MTIATDGDNMMAVVRHSGNHRNTLGGITNSAVDYLPPSPTLNNLLSI